MFKNDSKKEIRRWPTTVVLGMTANARWHSTSLRCDEIKNNVGTNDNNVGERESAETVKLS